MKIAYLHLKDSVASIAEIETLKSEMELRQWSVFRSPDWFVAAFETQQSDHEIVNLAEDNLRESLNLAGKQTLNESDVTCLILDAFSDDVSDPAAGLPVFI